MQVIKIGNYREVPNNYTGIAKYPNGLKEWYLNGKRHREDGPAYEGAGGSKGWYLNGKTHRVGGPAVEYPDGLKEWYLNGKRHREDGPAVEYPDGSKRWFLKGECHREDGPAVEYPDGEKVWWMNDKPLFSLPPESQPFVFLEEFVDEEGKKQIKVLTQEGIKIWPNLPGLKELADNWRT